MSNLVISLKSDNIFEKDKIYEAGLVYNSVYDSFIDIVINSELFTIETNDKDFVIILNPTTEISELIKNWKVRKEGEFYATN